jgi:hypothetical protein
LVGSMLASACATCFFHSFFFLSLFSPFKPLP